MTYIPVSDTPAHLQVLMSDRGFGRLPEIPSEYGGGIRVYESSSAEGPHLWLTATAPADLNDRKGPTVEAPLHMTLDNAVKFAEQILHLAANHYQRRKA